MLPAMTEPPPAADGDGPRTFAAIDKTAQEIAKNDAVCRRLMTVPAGRRADLSDRRRCSAPF
jgi:hypothetical protein